MFVAKRGQNHQSTLNIDGHKVKCEGDAAAGTDEGFAALAAEQKPEGGRLKVAKPKLVSDSGVTASRSCTLSPSEVALWIRQRSEALAAEGAPANGKPHTRVNSKAALPA